MSETDNNTQTQKPKTSKLSISSIVCLIISLLCLFMFAEAESSGSNEAAYFFGLMGYFCLLATPILGIAALLKIKKSDGILPGKGLAIASISLSAFLIILALIMPQMGKTPPIPKCQSNLNILAMGMKAYVREHDAKYPTMKKWCDLLIEGKYAYKKTLFKCLGDKKGPCSYAINPHCGPNSPNDVVLLFETKGGWNQFGGPEILTLENHKGKGCNILFNDGSVRFIKPQEVSELKWNLEEDEISTSNFRRPGNNEDLKYWLENMVWYHHFTNKEIRAATGLTEKEVIAALKKFDIRQESRPKRAEDAPLLIMPYPGGRHPRIGFLDGAIEPQRETKFSVFTPWDANSYVVVDVPEAIWSNLGLTYLAHTHIDTIWTKQRIKLSKLEWKRHADGTLDIERKLPNGIVFGVKVKPTKVAVLMELWLKNGTDQKLSDLRVQNCVMTKMAVGFEQQTNENKTLTNPYVACRSSDGRKWIITAWENCNNPWANQKCPCFHSDPKFPDIEPGQMYKLHGWLSFYEGTDIKAEFKRIEAIGWRKK